MITMARPTDSICDSTYDFTDISVAPSRGVGGGESSVCSSVSRLGTSHSHARRTPARTRPWTSAGGDDASVASVSMSTLIKGGYTANSSSNNDKLKNDRSPSEVAKGLESHIDRLIEKSVLLKKEQKLEEALESAKEATKKEQLLRNHRKGNHSELMHSTWFNLATAYEANEMPEEAMKTYTYLAKQRGSPFAGRLRINMGNIYYAQQKYLSAIKMYKMALDQMKSDDKSMAHKIRRNIGNAYFRMGKIRDAVKNFEAAMNVAPDYQTGFNLLVCHRALGDVDNMKRDFEVLMEIQSDVPDDHVLLEDAPHESKCQMDTRSKEANHFLLTAARLIAPMLDSQDWSAGYDWVCNALEERHGELATQVKLEQSTQQLKRKDESRVAIKTMKTLQKKSNEVKAATATNLSFVSFLEDNIDRASEYADVALGSDRYDAMALVNKGNCLFVNGEFAFAKDLYLEAIGAQADCAQAIFNLGLANAQLGLAEEAIHAFEKVHRIIPNNPQIIYQIADIYELQGRPHEAIKWFNVLAARVPSDTTVLARLGQLYAETKDESQGLHYQLEAFRHYPVDLDVISWIGTWFVQQEMFARSIYFFTQASLVNKKEIKWGFMVASAHKRTGDHDAALRVYEKLHDLFPEDAECLRYLIATMKSLGAPSFKYEDKLDRLIGN